MQNSAARESLISQGNFAVAYAGIPFTELSDRERMERQLSGNVVITCRTEEKRKLCREIR